MCSTELFSRRNQVTRIETTDGPVIHKRFLNPVCAKTEADVYRRLEAAPIYHAQLLEAADDALLLQALPGENFSDLLERQEASGNCSLEPWARLFNWISDFCSLTGMTLTDCNLRNFLYDEESGLACGVDFEECCQGSASEALARLSAHILLHRPEETVFKRELVTMLCHASADAPQPEQIEAEVKVLRLRRSMRGNKGFSAAVLAGGQSSRMGRDKAALPFRGTTLLEYQVRKLCLLGIEDVMISGSSLPVSGARFVPDVYPGHGPLSGIHACLASAKHDSVLFLSVDTPLIPIKALLALLDAHTSEVTLLCHSGQTEPLLGVYDRTLADLCVPILQSDRTKVWRLLNQANVRRVMFEEDGAAFLNCNTPEDYDVIMKMEPPFEA